MVKFVEIVEIPVVYLFQYMSSARVVKERKRKIYINIFQRGQDGLQDHTREKKTLKLFILDKENQPHAFNTREFHMFVPRDGDIYIRHLEKYIDNYLPSSRFIFYFYATHNVMNNCLGNSGSLFPNDECLNILRNMSN